MTCLILLWFFVVFYVEVLFFLLVWTSLGLFVYFYKMTSLLIRNQSAWPLLVTWSLFVYLSERKLRLNYREILEETPSIHPHSPTFIMYTYMYVIGYCMCSVCILFMLFAFIIFFSTHSFQYLILCTSVCCYLRGSDCIRWCQIFYVFRTFSSLFWPPKFV